MTREKYITADQAFEFLRLYIKCANNNGVILSKEQIEYCEEWLFDCVHCTGECSISTPLQIFNDSFIEFKPTYII